MSEHYLYQVTVTPPCGVGLRQTEVAAGNQDEADAKATQMIRDWVWEWAQRDRTPREWTVGQRGRPVGSGVAEPEPTQN